MDIKDLYQQIILDHSHSPQNRIDDSDQTEYIKKRGFNPSCGDDIVMFVEIQNNTISKIKQHAQGCSICVASTSILTMVLEGKTLAEAKTITENFINMILSKPYDKTVVDGQMKAFEGVKDFPARVKCALLSWKTVLEIISEYETEK